MLFKTIRQNLAGFAAVALAFTGFTAISPSTAATSALTDSASMRFEVSRNVTLSGSTGTVTVADGTNIGRGLISTNWTIDQATANSFVGSTMSATVTLTGPSGAIDLQAAGFFQQFLIYAQANTVVASGQPNSAVTAVWPAGANASSTSILVSLYNNNSTFSFAPGNYTITYTLKKDGVTVPLSSGVALSNPRMDYYVPGRTMSALESGNTTWNSGFVCVDMTQVVAGDVLTIERDINGTTSTSGSMVDWYRGGDAFTSVAFNNGRAVTAADVTAGSLAVKARVDLLSVTTGQAVAASLNIKKANNTDVSVPCGPASAPAAPTATSMGSSATVAASGSIPAGFRLSCQLINSSNVVVATGTSNTSPCTVSTMTSGTYTTKLAYTTFGVAGAYSPASNSVTLTIGGGGSPVCGSTVTSIHASVATLTPSGSFTQYFNNDPLLTGCMTQQFTGAGTRATLNGTQIGTPFFSGSVAFIASNSPRTWTSLTTSAAFTGITIQDGDVYTLSYYRNLSAAPTANDVAFMSYSITLYPSGNVPNNNQQVQNNNTPSVSVVPTNIPLVRPTLALSQTVRAGGTLVIDAANAASVSEIKVGGVAAKLEKVTAGVEIQVPTGLTPGAKDLFIKTDTGSTLHVGAIKIADPIVEAAKLAYAKAASTVAFRAPIDQAVAGARPSASQVAEARAHAAEYKTAKEAVCVAVPASKATAASARAAATALCAAMKSVNRKLKVTVVVEAPSGDKTNVITSELVG